jgi:hypothetical protein
VAEVFVLPAFQYRMSERTSLKSAFVWRLVIGRQHSNNFPNCRGYPQLLTPDLIECGEGDRSYYLALQDPPRLGRSARERMENRGDHGDLRTIKGIDGPHGRSSVIWWALH